MARKKKFRWRYLVIGLILLVFFLILGPCTGGVFSLIPYLHLDSFSGRVIDADTKEPISGAVVLAVYYKSLASVAGSSSLTVDGQEILSDENGEFTISEKRRWFALYRGYTEGNLTIFKPGYGAFPTHKSSKAIGENKSWPPPEKYVVYELPKLKTWEERRSNLPTRPEIPYKKMRAFLRLINEERIDLGLNPLTIPKEESK